VKAAAAGDKVRIVDNPIPVPAAPFKKWQMVYRLRVRHIPKGLPHAPQHGFLGINAVLLDKLHSHIDVHPTANDIQARDRRLQRKVMPGGTEEITNVSPGRIMVKKPDPIVLDTGCRLFSGTLTEYGF
jgi:hypothetical protein